MPQLISKCSSKGIHISASLLVQSTIKSDWLSVFGDENQKTTDASPNTKNSFNSGNVWIAHTTFSTTSISNGGSILY